MQIVRSVDGDRRTTDGSTAVENETDRGLVLADDELVARIGLLELGQHERCSCVSV